MLLQATALEPARIRVPRNACVPTWSAECLRPDVVRGKLAPRRGPRNACVPTRPAERRSMSIAKSQPALIGTAMRLFFIDRNLGGIFTSCHSRRISPWPLNRRSALILPPWRLRRLFLPPGRLRRRRRRGRRQRALTPLAIGVAPLIAPVVVLRVHLPSVIPLLPVAVKAVPLVVPLQDQDGMRAPDVVRAWISERFNPFRGLGLGGVFRGFAHG